MILYSFMSHIHELGLGTLLCSHETNPFVVQPYEPILLIVLPYRLLVSSKSSKPSQLGPWYARNHHTMDSSPNSSRWEHNSSLPIVRPTHLITIIRTLRPLVADGNSTSFMPIMRPTIKHIQTPIGLSPSSPKHHTTCIYFLYLGKSSQNQRIKHIQTWQFT